MGLQKAALISVFDKSRIVEFAKSLKDLGYVLLTSTGSAKHLKENGIDSVLIEDYTKQREILDGRVKTLHPKIHAGLLAKRDNPEHIKQMQEDGIYDISVVAVNLYPFIENLGTEKAKDYNNMIELIDIGGPTMLRASAKNFKSIYSIIDPSDYSKVINNIKNSNNDLEFRRELAAKVFSSIANYNLEIAKYFSTVSLENQEVDFDFAEIKGLVLKKSQSLRYGENPHQKAVFYKAANHQQSTWKQLWGKELSYNNFLDFDATAKIIQSFETNLPTAVIVKHLNPCGAAIGKDLVTALKNAKLGDPRSHFGGIIALNQKVDVATAAEIVKDFAEIVLAPSFEPEAISILEKKKNLRIIEIDLSNKTKLEMRTCADGFLLQEYDSVISSVTNAELVTERKVSESEKQDLDFAWKICQFVKSNAIVIVKDKTLIATGAGQMSRIDSAELAISKAKTHSHQLSGAVAASDAFFPFPDSLEKLANEGVTAIIVTGGAMQDEEVKKAAKEKGISLLFTSDRHFRH